jgi:YHS domain-containing protein
MACYAIFIASWWRSDRFGRGIAVLCRRRVAACIALYHYRLIRGRTREGCFKAFLHNNWIGAAIFAGIVADHLPQLRAAALRARGAGRRHRPGRLRNHARHHRDQPRREPHAAGLRPGRVLHRRQPVRGKHTIHAAHEGRTYYFATPEHRASFVAAPAKYEPQYGGFCSNGAPYAVKLGSDPTQFEIRDARLFIFGDILGHEMWLLDWKTNIERADRLWPQIRDKGWRGQSLQAWISKVRGTARERASWRSGKPSTRAARWNTTPAAPSTTWSSNLPAGARAKATANPRSAFRGSGRQ